MQMGDGELERRVRDLGERAKELTALHGAARAMLRPDVELDARMNELVALLPPAMLRPEVATASVVFAGRSWSTPGHGATSWMLRAPFRARHGEGSIEVAYAEPLDEPAFLPEEQTLLESIADIVRTVLDRDDADREAAASHERFNLALEAAGMGVWEWDVVAGTTRWSRQLSRLFGIDPSSTGAFAQHAEIIHPDDRERVFRRLEQAKHGADDLRALELRMRRADGAWVHFAGTARILRDRTSAVSRIVVALLDVTERRALEDGLRQAQKQEALGQVASGVAHDLNNLMGVLLSGTATLREELKPATGSWSEIIDDLQLASERCAGLAQQLLTFSRRAAFHPAPVDVSRVVTRLEPVLRRLARRGVQLAVEADPDAGLVWADAAQLEQVSMNLVVNARDAMPKGGRIVVSVRARAKPEGPGEIVIEVSDDGPGIDPAIRDRIFEPFFTTKPVGEGTGLGLAVVSSVAQRWQGCVEIDTEVGRGTAIRVVLPRLPR